MRVLDAPRQTMQQAVGRDVRIAATAGLGFYHLLHAVVSLPIESRAVLFFRTTPACASWRLDIINELASALAAGNVLFDSCAWGRLDPGNNKPYFKRQRLIGNAPLASLCRRCFCQCERQRAEGTITRGPRQGAKRSVAAGEYPLEFGRALADLIRSHVDVRNQ